MDKKIDYKKIAELLYPDTKETIADLLKKYPQRKLPEGAEVTRFAPSPTGYLHIGNFFSAVLDYMVAKQTNGVFYLRIEDTDSKREIKDAVDVIPYVLKQFELEPDEGYQLGGGETGEYGPYVQSKRQSLYNVFIKDLISRGLAYPCFCESVDDSVEEEQRKLGVPIGYYGKWAKCRTLSYEQIKTNIDAGMPYTIRIKADGDGVERITFDDFKFGTITMPKNYNDYILIKSDKQTLYHFAHLVDDTLMHTTTVIRGEDWLSSVPLHLQLFSYFGFVAPKYLHTALIMTVDKETGSQRKISKRYDPWADSRWFIRMGYPADVVKEYIVNLLNSEFEPWRLKNPDAPLSDYKLNLKNLGKTCPMFDMVKLNDISKNYISKLDENKVYSDTLKWAETFDVSFAEILKANKSKFVQMFAIDRHKARPRKDISNYSEVKSLFSYVVDFTPNLNEIESFDSTTKRCVLHAYLDSFSIKDDNQTWFDKVKEVAVKCGFAGEMRDYKQSPEKYFGSVADVSTIIRVAITGKTTTPDLNQIIQVLGENEMRSRIQSSINILNK